MLALGVISVSSAAVFIRLAEAPPLIIAAYRLCLASLVIVPVAAVRSRKELHNLARRDIVLLLVSGFFLALHFALWVSSLSYTTVATSVVLVTTNPVFVSIASYFFFRERLGKRTMLGILICFIGAILIGYGNWKIGPEPLLGGVLALLGALAFAGHLLIGRRVRQRIGLLTYASLTYSSAGIILLLAALIAGHSFTGYSGNTYLMLLLLALVPQLIGHSSVNWALRFVSATMVTIAILGEPVGAAALACLVLDEVPTWTEIGGSILILSGIFIALRRKKEVM